MCFLARFVGVAAIAGIAAGCTSDANRRTESVTFGAGNAIAANSAMQMVDPWQEGVQNTRLRVPADRGSHSGSAADQAASAKESQTTSTNY